MRGEELRKGVGLGHPVERRAEGSAIARSREVCRATVLSTTAGRPGPTGTTSRCTALRWEGRISDAVAGSEVTVRAAMPMPMSEALVRQLSQAVSAAEAPVRIRTRWCRARDR